MGRLRWVTLHGGCFWGGGVLGGGRGMDLWDDGGVEMIYASCGSFFTCLFGS